MASENSKLLSSGETKNFYFLNRNNSSTAKGEDGIGFTELNEVELPRIPSIGNILHWVGGLFQRNSNHNYHQVANKPRKVPIKVEPKVFFANERTFLAWLHMSVTLSSISIAIIAFAEANEWSQLYGLLLMPVAISFCVYSLWMYIKRSAMIRRKDPGPYEDKVGPLVLASMLALSITVNFFVKLYDLAT